MSGGNSISGASMMSGVERIARADNGPRMKSEGEKPASADALIASVHSSKELKQAELAGEEVSLGIEQTIKAIERANKALQGKDISMHFSIHEKTKQIMVKVVDVETGDTVREFPPEKILDLVAKIMEKSGVFIDEKR